ncbi:MAG: trimeric intracellular cation channel family protein [Nitrosopumilus sp.]|nr:trimeric intracellular cation channel family protein [Nitrosopumilus sp.]
MIDLQYVLIFYPEIILFLDYFGTVAFAITGAFKAIEQKADIVGVVILSSVTGLAGGLIRDVIFGRYPPTALSDPMYLILSIITGFSIFFLYPRLKKHWGLFLKCDAVGLGVFTVIGASAAYSIFGPNLLLVSIGGLITATGGGILRDILVNEIPLVFVRELYATASFVGVVVFYILIILSDPVIAAISGIISATGIRLLAIKYAWNLPKVKT